MKLYRCAIRIIFCFSFALTTNAYGQQLRFEHLDIRDGLPAMEVYNLYKDKLGYVWAFTEFGIVKHNGKKFIPACTNLPPSEATIYTYDESPGGKLFVGNSRCNFYQIINDSALLIPGFASQAGYLRDQNQVFCSLRVDENGDFWYNTSDFSYFFSPKSNEFLMLSGTPGYSKGLVFRNIAGQYSVIKSLESQVSKGPTRIYDRNGKLEANLDVPSGALERNAMISTGDRKYLLYDKDVYLLHNGVQTRFHFADAAIKFRRAPDGNIWIATYSGIIVLDANLNEVSRYLNDIIISDILFDHSDGLWISTIGQGVFHCRNTQQKFYDELPGLHGNITLLKPLGFHMLIGTHDGRLYLDTKGRIEALMQLPDRPHITDVIQTEDGYLIGTKKNIFRISPAFASLPFRQLKSAGVYGFAKSVNDTLLALSGTSVLKYYKSSLVGLIAAPSRTRSIIRDHSGTMYVGTFEGLYTVIDDKFRIPSNLWSLRSLKINSLVTDSSGALWICTKFNGLYRLTARGRLSRIKGLPAESIKDILFINDSIILLSTNKGVFHNTRQSLEKPSSWRILLADEIAASAVYGRNLYLATNAGLTTIPLKKMNAFFPTPFYLRSAKCGNKRLSGNQIRLQYNENDLLFDFDVLDYRALGTSLLYALEGPYRSSGNVIGDQLHLQNLSPGNYDLKVYAINGGTSNGGRSIHLQFTIIPAFWQTGTFLIEVVLLGICIVIALIYFIFIRLRKREEKKSLIARMLVEYRLTALKSQINPHFLSNSITAVQELVLTNELDKANQYLAKFGLLIRIILNYSDRFAANLALELQIIDLYIELEQLRFKNRFIFEKDIAPEIRIDEIFIPPLITQPFIENAIWHGLLPLKDKRTPKVTLRMTTENGDLNIAIIDNGVGRKNKAADHVERISRGTDLIVRRIENLNLMYSTNGISIRFTDLFDEAGQPAGFRVDIHFPANVLNSLYDEKDKNNINR